MNTPRKYRKKPVVIEAIRWTGTPESATEVIRWAFASEGGRSRKPTLVPRCNATRTLVYTSCHTPAAS